MEYTNLHSLLKSAAKVACDRLCRYNAGPENKLEGEMERKRGGAKRYSLQAVELSQRLQTANCVETSRPQQCDPDLPFFLESRPCRPDGWLALHLINAADVETNPGRTTTHKQVWIFAISHKQYTVVSRYP